MAKLVSVGGRPIAPTAGTDAANAEHVVAMTFADGHAIEGGKVIVRGVTAEQIAVAILYLQQAAAMMFNAAQIARMRADDEIAAAGAAVAAERKGN